MPSNHLTDSSVKLVDDQSTTSQNTSHTVTTVQTNDKGEMVCSCVNSSLEERVLDSSQIVEYKTTALSESEFNELLEKIKDAYFKAAELVPAFDKNKSVTQEQLYKIGEYISRPFWMLPYCQQIEKLKNSISLCLDNN